MKGSKNHKSRQSQISLLFPDEPSNSANEWHGSASGRFKWSIYQGQASAILRTLPKESVSCVVTSPPYYSLRDYGVSGQIGLEDTVNEYVTCIVDVFSEIKRILVPGGLLFLNLGDTYYSGKGKSHGQDRKSTKRRFGLRPVDKSGGLGIGLQRKALIGVPWRVALAMLEQGWVLRSSIIWHREKALPEHVTDRPSRSYENVFMFAKDRHYYFDKKPLIDQKVEQDMWTIAPRPRSNSLDTAPYPDQLVQRCLQVGCAPGGVVLDPFVGSGTTARVAIEMGHPAIGIDLSREFCLHTVNSLRQL